MGSLSVGAIRKRRNITLFQSHSSKARQGLLSYTAHVKALVSARPVSMGSGDPMAAKCSSMRRWCRGVGHSTRPICSEDHLADRFARDAKDYLRIR